MKTRQSATRLRAFFALTFAWSWTCWALSPAAMALLGIWSNADVLLGHLRPGSVQVRAGASVAIGGWLGPVRGERIVSL